MPSAEFAFTKSQRLGKAEEFSQVFNKGQRHKNKGIILISYPNGTQTNRLGLAIAKRSISLSTRRNRVRRLIRETFRQHQASLPGLDIVAITVRNFTPQHFDQLFTDLTQQWQLLINSSNKAAST